MLAMDPPRFVARANAMMDDASLQLVAQREGFYLYRRVRGAAATALLDKATARAALARDVDTFRAQIRERQRVRPGWVRWVTGMMPRPLGLP